MSNNTSILNREIKHNEKINDHDFSEFFSISPLSSFWTLNQKDLIKFIEFWKERKTPFSQEELENYNGLSEFKVEKILKELLKYKFIELIDKGPKKRGPFIYRFEKEHRFKRKIGFIDKILRKEFDQQFLTSPQDRKNLTFRVNWNEIFKPNNYHFKKISEISNNITKNIINKEEKKKIIDFCRTSLQENLESEAWIKLAIENLKEFAHAAITTCNQQIRNIPRVYHRQRFVECLIILINKFIEHIWYVEAIWKLKNISNLNFLNNPVFKKELKKYRVYKDKLLRTKKYNLLKNLAFLLTDGNISRSNERYEIAFTSKNPILRREFEKNIKLIDDKINIYKKPFTSVVKNKKLVDISYNFSPTYRAKKCIHWPLCPKFLDKLSGIPCLECTPFKDHYPPTTYIKLINYIKYFLGEIKKKSNINNKNQLKDILQIISSTEGSFSLSKGRRNNKDYYIQYYISLASHNPHLLDEFSEILNLMGINHIKKQNEIIIRAIDEIRKFRNKIGFHIEVTVLQGHYKGAYKSSVLNSGLIISELISKNIFNPSLVGKYVDLNKILKIIVNKFDHIMKNSTSSDYNDKLNLASFTVQELITKLNEFIKKIRTSMNEEEITNYLSHLFDFNFTEDLEQI